MKRSLAPALSKMDVTPSDSSQKVKVVLVSCPFLCTLVPTYLIEMETQRTNKPGHPCVMPLTHAYDKVFQIYRV
jgi:hypothetical protein